MATIGTAIQLNDMMSAPIRHIISAMDGLLSSWNELEGSTRNGLDVGNIESVRANLKLASNAMDEMEKEQREVNREVQQGANAMDGFTDSIMGAVAAYAGFQGLKQLVDLSDTYTQTQARLSMIVDEQSNVEELNNKIFASAQRARAPYQDMADTVSKLSLNAGDAFKSNDETILFAENLNKLFAIAGTEQASISSATLQLTQALGSGVLRGEEFNAVFEAAPNIMQTVADYMNVPIGKLRSMAQEGQITAEIVKNALLSATDKINTQFESIPMTWSQVWTGVLNELYQASIPLLEFISLLAQNWAVLEPIFIGIATAVGLYTTALVINTAVTKLDALAKAISGAAMMFYRGETFKATAQQYGFNAALLACPLTWIVVLIIAVVAGLFALCAYLAKTKNMANSAFGVMAGGANVVIQWFKNLGLTVANVALGIGNAIGALGTNMMTSFHNAISSIKSWFYGLLATGLETIEGICAALNKLPFVEFDYSGITASADAYAAKASAEAKNTKEYQSISDAFNEGMSTFDTFQDGWVQKAFDAGAAWGDGISENVNEFFGGSGDDPLSEYQSLLEGIGDIPEIDDIATNTGDIAKGLEITNEDLKYLRDLAEAEVVNRFTTAEIKVEMTNNNNVSSDMDLDGIVDYLSNSVNEAMMKAAEGVHV